MTLKAIFAQSHNGIFGDNGKLPWHISEDLQIFKEKTKDTTVVMGRKTWDSLPTKPLPGRINCVISSKPVRHRNAIWIQQPLSVITNEEETKWIIGGTSILQFYMPYCDEIHRTIIDLDAQGDVYAPEIPNKLFKLVSLDHYISKSGIRFKIEVYQKNHLLQAPNISRFSLLQKTQ